MGRLPRLFRPAAWPIAVKLSTALLLAALLPMSITAYYNLQGSLTAVEAEEYLDLESLATSTANRLDQLFIDTQRVVIHVSADSEVVAFLSAPPEEREAFRGSAEAELETVFLSNPDYAIVYLMDREGLCLLATDPDIVGGNYSFREYFQEAIQGRPHISDILVGVVTKRPGLFFSAPVRDESGGIVGAAVIKMWGEAIWAIVDALQVGAGGYAFLIDQDGVIIGHPDKSLLYHSLVPLPPDTLDEIVSEKRFLLDEIESVDVPELAEAMVGAEEPGHTSYYFRQTHKIVGFAPLAEHTWVVGVNEPKEQFTSPLKRLARRTNLSVLAVGGIVIVMALLLARGIVRPIHALIGAARAIERGERFEPERIAGLAKARDELAHLARVFSQMAVEVQAREERLKKQVKELRIEIDESKKDRQVAEITETEYFQRLREHAREMRKRAKGE